MQSVGRTPTSRDIPPSVPRHTSQYRAVMIGWPLSVGGGKGAPSHAPSSAMTPSRPEDFNLDENYFFNQTRFNDTLFDVIAYTLNVYYTPLMIFLGILGNFLSVYVFFTTKLKYQSTSQYLSALAISDTVFLLQLLPAWLNTMQISPLFHMEGWCQFLVYTSYVSCCISSWLVVAFTVERFVAVLYPLQRNVLCTVTRARAIILIIVMASVFLNLPVLRFAKPTDRDCNINMKYLNEAAHFNMVDTAVSFTIPFGVIVVLNTWITSKMWQQALVWRLQAVGRRGSGDLGLPPPPLPPRMPPRSQQHVTRMLLLVSSVFVLLNLPAYALRILAYAYDIDKQQIHGWNGMQQTSLICFNTTYGINFLLYCVGGQNFRTALVESMPCHRLRVRRAAMLRHRSRPAQPSSISASVASNDAGSTPDRRRTRRTDYISRWTFDNSRQRGQITNAQRETRDSFELSDMRIGA